MVLNPENTVQANSWKKVERWPDFRHPTTVANVVIVTTKTTVNQPNKQLRVQRKGRRAMNTTSIDGSEAV